MNTPNQIPETIRYYREARNLSLQALAEEVGVAVSTVSRWERGLSVPPAPEANALAKALRISIQTLIEGRKAG